MQSITTVTQKGQVTIPKEMRDKYGIESYSKVRMKEGKNHIKIYREGPDILELAGTFKIPGGESVLKAREEMERNYKRT